MNNKFDLLPSGGAKISAGALCDLDFDAIGEAVFGDAPRAFKNFSEVLSTPAAERDAVLERQRIYLDFCAYPFLIDKISEYCDGAAAFYLNPFGKTFRTVHDRLKYYLSNTLELIDLYDKFPNVLGKLRFSSSALGGYSQEPCASLKEELEKLAALYTSANFSLNVSFNEGFKLKSASLNGVESIKAPKAGALKRKGAGGSPFSEDSIFFGNNNVIYNVVDELKNSMILNLCRNISNINSSIKEFFVNVRAQTAFYESAIALQKYMEERGIPFCMPKADADLRRGICAKGLYDLGLTALLPTKNIVCNDISMEKGKTLIVTGHNRGGKTTFLKSIGIAQILAQAGLPVPAREYSCPIYKGILTHFPSGEDKSLGDGKLAEELTRLHKDFHVLKGGGLALFNESFTTTTTREGSEIGIDVLRAVGASGSHAVFVTHLMELAEKRSALGEVVSLTTESSNSYKIVEGEPLEDIRAYEML